MQKLIWIVIGVVLVAVFFYRSSQNKQSAQQNKDKATRYLLENGQQDDIQTTDSGLQFKQLEAGTGTEHPKATDKVLVHYHGTLTDGTVFDSSVDRGEPISFGLNQVIAGWTEGLQLMVEGEKARLYIPSELAYGDRNVGVIKPGSLLIFDVELIKINP